MDSPSLGGNCSGASRFPSRLLVCRERRRDPDATRPHSPRGAFRGHQNPPDLGILGLFGFVLLDFGLEFSPRYLYGSRQRIPAPLPADIRGLCSHSQRWRSEEGCCCSISMTLPERSCPRQHPGCKSEGKFLKFPIFALAPPLTGETQASPVTRSTAVGQGEGFFFQIGGKTSLDPSSFPPPATPPWG